MFRDNGKSLQHTFSKAIEINGSEKNEGQENHFFESTWKWFQRVLLNFLPLEMMLTQNRDFLDFSSSVTFLTRFFPLWRGYEILIKPTVKKTYLVIFFLGGESGHI